MPQDNDIEELPFCIILPAVKRGRRVVDLLFCFRMTRRDRIDLIYLKHTRESVGEKYNAAAQEKFCCRFFTCTAAADAHE